jgi:hypothetical protein
LNYGSLNANNYPRYVTPPIGLRVTVTSKIMTDLHTLRALRDEAKTAFRGLKYPSPQCVARFNAAMLELSNVLFSILHQCAEQKDPHLAMLMHFDGVDALYSTIKRLSDFNNKSLSTHFETYEMTPDKCIALLDSNHIRRDVSSKLMDTPPTGTTFTKRMCVFVEIPVGNQSLKFVEVKNYFTSSPLRTTTREFRVECGVLDAIQDDTELVGYLEEKCVVCAKKRGLRTCSRCNQARYCGAGHQRDHWKTHKPHCGRIQNLRIESLIN